MLRRRNGFTLIEILIVIVIIGLLAFTLIPRILAAQQRARDTGRIADVRQIGMGLQSYIYTNNTIPDSAGTGYKDIASISGALLEHLKSIPDDKGRGLMVNSAGDCISSGDNYAYFPSLAENSAIATATMEGGRGNTANCRGIVSTKMSFPRHSDGYNITPKDYSPGDVLMNNPHPICTHPNMTVPEIECEALMAFYDSTDGPNRTTNTNRGASPDVGSWYGITVVGGKVTEIQFTSNNNFQGYITEDFLTYFPALTVFYFLNQSNAELSSVPTDLTNNTELISFLFSNNIRARGGIPTDLTNNIHLEEFRAYNNRYISGPIPMDFSENNSLRYFEIHYNADLGPYNFPNSICNVPTLISLQMRSSNLQGSLPDNCAGAASWQSFQVQNNKLNRDAGGNAFLSPSAQIRYAPIQSKNISNQSGPLTQ